jgi:glutathione S-transferase
MKLFESRRAPNPRRVNIFLAEKGIAVPTEQVDLLKLEQKGEPFSALNPVQQVPALVLDDGFVLAETIAICRYFEELHPEPPLFGTDAFGRALVEMWQRRIEFGLLGPVAAVFRHLHPAMAQMEVPQVPAWGEANRERVNRFLAVLDTELEGQEFICGESFTIADITGLVGLDFMKPAKLTVAEEFRHVLRWHARLSERPSAKA